MKYPHVIIVLCLANSCHMKAFLIQVIEELCAVEVLSGCYA